MIRWSGKQRRIHKDCSLPKIWDFSDIRLYKPGTHYGIVLVRLRKPGREALKKRIKYLFETEEVEKWPGCFIVVTEHKIRIRRP